MAHLLQRFWRAGNELYIRRWRKEWRTKSTLNRSEYWVLLCILAHTLCPYPLLLSFWISLLKTCPSLSFILEFGPIYFASIARASKYIGCSPSRLYFQVILFQNDNKMRTWARRLPRGVNIKYVVPSRYYYSFQIQSPNITVQHPHTKGSIRQSSIKNHQINKQKNTNTIQTSAPTGQKI